MILTAKKHKKLAAGVLTCAAIVGGGIGYSLAHTSDQVDAVREAAVKSCELSKQPGGVRYIIAEQLHMQLKQGKHFDYNQFFPSVPPDQLKALIRQSRKQQRQEIHDLLGFDCAKQFK